MIKWRFVRGSSLKTNRRIKKGKVRCLIWVKAGIGWGFNPLKFTVSSNFSSVEVWITPVISRIRVTVEYCRLLIFLFTGWMWYLRSCLGWLSIWLSILSINCYGSGVEGLEFYYSVWFGRSAVLIELKEPIDSWFPFGGVDLGYESTVSEVWIPEEALRHIGTPQRRGRKIFRGRWTRLFVLTQYWRDRIWCWSFTRGRQCLNWCWSQVAGKSSYSLRRGYWCIFWRSSIFTIRKILERICAVKTRRQFWI